MRFSRLFSASLLVAAVTVLASCGESTTPAATDPVDPSLGLGTREYTLAPNFVSWERDLEAPLPTDTKTVMIGGVIAVASYPTFGPVVYEGEGNDWLEFIHGPSTASFSRAPLGWNVGFKLKPSAADLPDGPHTATIAVNVPAALNNPQIITVSFGCNALVVDGGYRYGELTSGDPKWDRDTEEYNNDPSGGYLYDDWCVRVPGYSTVRVDMIGSPCSNPNFTLSDPYLFTFTQPDHDFVDEDDDAGCGYNSINYIWNGSPETRSYLVRATAYCSFDDEEGDSCSEGTYEIEARSWDDAVRTKEPVTKESGDKVTIKPSARLQH